MKELSEKTIDELKSQLKAARSIQITTTVIFVIIIVAWIALGYWRTNIPVFVSTIAMALMATAITNILPAKLSSEIARRSSEQNSEQPDG